MGAFAGWVHVSTCVMRGLLNQDNPPGYPLFELPSSFKECTSWDYWRPYSCYTDGSNSSVLYLCIASGMQPSSVVLLAAAVAPFGVFNSDISATLATK